MSSPHSAQKRCAGISNAVEMDRVRFVASATAGIDQRMIDKTTAPRSDLEKATMLEGLLIDCATGAPAGEETYMALRREFMAAPSLRVLLPEFVLEHRNFGSFWPYIKHEAKTYAERRGIISRAFTPLMDHLEKNNAAPLDRIASAVLENFDARGVNDVWQKALDRRDADPEGAITMARTLLETVTKRILDECGEPYAEKDDLPKLYSSAAQVLKLAPSQHTEKPIKAILGGAMNLVNGLGTLRNRMSDAHGHGGKLAVRPSPRHASLAVNTAGAIATFLVETFHERKAGGDE